MLAAAMGGMGSSMGHAADMVMEIKNVTDDYNRLVAPTLRSARKGKGRVAQNQRQRRKDKRRAHAAGCKQAFLR